MAFAERVRELGRDVPTLGWVGFGVTAGFLLFAAVTIAGYALTDQGSWTGLGLTALWLVPTVALTLWAVYRPRAAIRGLTVAALLPIAFGAWTLVAYADVMAWEDRTGPVSLVLLVVVGLPLAVAGLSLPRPAGALLLGVSLLPWALSVLGAGSDWGRALSIGVVTVPVVAGGVLLVLAGRSGAGAGTDLRSRPPVPGH